MKRATGPGRVELLSNPPFDRDFQLCARLFNFDFDDAALKREHADWLDRHAVPGLTADATTRAVLHGTASRVGKADYNRALSVRRVEAVKSHLVARGVPANRLEVSASGEDLSTSAKSDDERDRAVVIRLAVTPGGPTRIDVLHPPQRPVAVVALPPTFARGRRQGFAPGGLPDPPPGVIPLPNAMTIDMQRVGVIRVHNGVGKTLTIRHQGIARILDPRDQPPNAHDPTTVTVTREGQIFHILGVWGGKTFLSVGPADRVSPFQTGIAVTVRARVTTFFHFLGGPEGIRTARKPGEEQGLLKTMNAIYAGQTEVSFALGGLTPNLIVPGVASSGFPGVRVARASTPDMQAVRAHHRHEMVFNVFLIGRFIDVGGGGGSQENFGALTTRPPEDDKPLRSCLIRDPILPAEAGINFAQVLAHEAGHALGEHDFDDIRLLMHKNSPSGTLIPSDMSDRMLDSFSQFPP